jgi:hypothetical protein
MYKHIKRFAVLPLLLLINACGTPATLQYDNTHIKLQVAEKRIQVAGKQIKVNKENFSILFLEQKLLRLKDGSLVMFEKAETDMQYMFEPTTTRSISVIFDTVNVLKVYEKDFIFAYQLLLKDQRVLNIIISQGYDQEMQMVYGMSSEQFVKTLNRLNANITSVPYKHAIELKNEPNPLISNWTTWKINFYPLVIPLPRIGRF